MCGPAVSQLEHMDLIALADFTLVARHGGFGKAARAANRPKATLSRRVAELEASLDLRLFERGARDLKLTEEGRALFERAGALLIELEETIGAIASGGDRPRAAADQRTFAVLADRDGSARCRILAPLSGSQARGDDRGPVRRHDRGRLRPCDPGRSGSRRGADRATVSS